MAKPHWFIECLQAVWSEMTTICKMLASSAWLDRTQKFGNWKCTWQKATTHTWRVNLSQNHTLWQTTGKDFSAPWNNRSFHTTSMTSSSGHLEWKLITGTILKSWMSSSFSHCWSSSTGLSSCQESILTRLNSTCKSSRWLWRTSHSTKCQHTTWQLLLGQTSSDQNPLGPKTSRMWAATTSWLFRWSSSMICFSMRVLNTITSYKELKMKTEICCVKTLAPMLALVKSILIPWRST